MALVIGQDDTCDGVAVIDDDTGEVVSCHDDEDAAREAIAAAEAEAGNATTDVDAVLPERAVMVIAREGEETGDGRYVEPGALTWRDLPLTLTVNHDDSLIAGRVDAIGRTASIDGLTVDTFADVAGDTGDYVIGLVTFDLGLDANGTLVHADAYGRVAARQVAGGFLLGVSMEVGDQTVDYECVETDPDDPEFCIEYLMRLQAGRIGAVTVAPFQAIESARVVEVAAATVGPQWWPAPATQFTAHHRVGAADSALAASIVEPPMTPPAAWFDDPQLDGPTALTVDDDGRVYGHLALWDVCHIGMPGCRTAPRSATDYAYFLTGLVVTSEGERRAVGQLTVGTGHAPLDLSGPAAAAHYDNTGTAWADVAAGEDDHGIWIAGAVRPSVDDDTLRAALAAPPSGDWRPIRGALELVAALGVNVPGFPTPRARVASGATVALVASFAARPDCGCGGASMVADGRVEARLARAEARLARVDAVLAALSLDDAAVDALAASLRST